MPLHLPHVTLCAVTAINHELTVRAMRESLKYCRFADVVLISDKPVDAPFRVEIMPPFPDGSYYAEFICRNLGRYTSSSHNLLVQYDGYIADPSAWSDEFLAFDYIGAKWPWHKSKNRVGNSGFCLRSKKLLDILAAIELPPVGTYVDDTFVCYTIREILESRHGIRIAPERIADRFAYERHDPDGPVFGFHGMFNFWRHVPDDEMVAMPTQLDDYYVASRAFVEVLLHYYKAKNLPVFGAWYKRLSSHLSDKVEGHLLSYVNDTTYIGTLMAQGRDLLRS